MIRLAQTPADLHAEDQLMRVRERLGGNFELRRDHDGWHWDSPGLLLASRLFPTARHAVAHADMYTRLWWPLPAERAVAALRACGRTTP